MCIHYSHVKEGPLSILVQFNPFSPLLSLSLSLSLSLHLFELIFSLEVRILFYLNVLINYLSNINCNYVIIFYYHDNLPRRMRNLKLISFSSAKRN